VAQRRAEEPILWRCVGMEMESTSDKQWACRHRSSEMAMKLVAVDRAVGRCEAFQGYCDEYYLLNLVERYYDYILLYRIHLYRPLKGRRLFYCKLATGKGNRKDWNDLSSFCIYFQSKIGILSPAESESVSLTIM
jgi:hypothetical protein